MEDDRRVGGMRAGGRIRQTPSVAFGPCRQRRQGPIETRLADATAAPKHFQAVILGQPFPDPIVPGGPRRRGSDVDELMQQGARAVLADERATHVEVQRFGA